jgi:adenylate cyclase
MSGRFTSFRARLLVVLVLLLAGTQALTCILVASAARTLASGQIRHRTDDAARVFERLVGQRMAELGLAARLLTSDYAFRSTFGQLRESSDPVALETLRSALENYRGRIPSEVFLSLNSTDGALLASTLPPGEPGPLPEEALAALENSAELELTTVRFVGERLFLVSIRPVLLPDPVAWIQVGFPVDAALAEDFSRLSGFEIAFLFQGRVVAATPALQELDPAPILAGGETVRLGRERYLGRTTLFPNQHGGEARILMLRSLDQELAPFRTLERALILLILLALAASVALSVYIARSVTRPVEALSRGVGRIAEGDFATRVPVRTSDELGRLGAAFNQMAGGLEERDRVQDLLGKAVSPQIAAKLVASELEFRGEMREVTILFTDLRGFTGLSESQKPRELLSQLNQYFTAITTVVEEHGGVVDKYIGDAIMVIFGAPVDLHDDADRAIAAARGILAAERRLNAERATAGLPPFRTGIGISTGLVVAGNMGSSRRFNYTVVGDEVNIASRLESMTKDPALQTHIICSDATRASLKTEHPGLRDLGEVQIRGKALPIRIWAVDV